VTTLGLVVGLVVMLVGAVGIAATLDPSRLQKGSPKWWASMAAGVGVFGGGVIFGLSAGLSLK
jgi:hypothetical protein